MYGMRPDYRPNLVAAANDAEPSPQYWSANRIALSRRYQWYAYRQARRLASRRGVRTVVDVGCGVGTKLDEFFGDRFDAFGVDQAFAVETARRLGRRGTYVAQNLQQETPSAALPRPADLVVSSDVIEHLADPDRVLAYIRELCGPDTFVVLTTPERIGLRGRESVTPGNPAHVREWSFDEFSMYVEASGFRILEHRTLLPFKLALDKMTAAWVRSTLRSRGRFRTNQYLVCRLTRDSS
jgi:SAM-dependent methyltransferase